MASRQERREREELDAKAQQGETVVPGGTGGKSLEAQEHLAEGKTELATAVCPSFSYTQQLRLESCKLFA